MTEREARQLENALRFPHSIDKGEVANGLAQLVAHLRQQGAFATPVLEPVEA
jgi:hypothetical protein